jgi:hypothetical protein
MCWTLVQGAVKNFYAFDMVHIARTAKGTFEAAPLLVEKLKSHKIKSVILIGDASGKSNKTSAAGETDYTIIKAALDEAGIEWEDIVPDANPSVKDRVNCFNAHCQDANGVSHFWLHPENCAPLKKDCQRQVWRDGSGKLHPGKDNSLGHAADGVGYLFHAVDPLQAFEDSFDLHIL